MKTDRTIILGLSIIIAVGIYSQHITPPQTIKATYEPPVDSKPPPVGVMMRVTAYCPCSRCCGKFSDGITASGYRIQPGDKFCAAPESFQFGTMLDVPGYGIVPVLDRGGVITAGRLDLYFDTHQAALKWGIKYLLIERKL